MSIVVMLIILNVQEKVFLDSWEKHRFMQVITKQGGLSQKLSSGMASNEEWTCMCNSVIVSYEWEPVPVTFLCILKGMLLVSFLQELVQLSQEVWYNSRRFSEKPTQILCSQWTHQPKAWCQGKANERFTSSHSLLPQKQIWRGGLLSARKIL